MLLPFWMWLAWYLTPKSLLNVTIVDKTVLTDPAQGHASLSWILRNKKYSKANGNLYIIKDDYYGSFPKNKSNYDIKGLERFSDPQLDNLSKRSDMMYVTDTYGIYENDLVPENKRKKYSKKIYGGLSSQDMRILKQFKRQKKLIITEFNTFSTPTSPVIAKDFENTFKIRWTGWVGRYFESLDTLQNKELPRWLLDNYKLQNNNKWPFRKGGIVFVHKNEKVVVLEYVTHLNSEVPLIITQKYQREKYNIPKSIKYSFWFDVVQTSTRNQIVSYYDIKVNRTGENILDQNGIPPQFPAVIEHDRKDYKFYYFCGDFADNPISQTGAYFKGIHFFKRMFYDNDIAAERISFFWEYYSPLVSSILKNYETKLPRNKSVSFIKVFPN
ncbi:MAG TPA: hypothetical protein VNI52_11660 [Sphingobacteriaceae bacterium]|nr:hypothetical protein [Sphingobacteriaceae bacterium]